MKDIIISTVKRYSSLPVGYRRILKLLSILIPIAAAVVVGSQKTDEEDVYLGGFAAFITSLAIYWAALAIFLWIRDGFINEK